MTGRNSIHSQYNGGVGTRRGKQGRQKEKFWRPKKGLSFFRILDIVVVKNVSSIYLTEPSGKILKGAASEKDCVEILSRHMINDQDALGVLKQDLTIR
jgi:hypothetical protein